MIKDLLNKPFKKVLVLLLCLPFIGLAQGIYNNGAYIVLNSGPSVYVDGTGGYTNVTNGAAHGRIAVNTSGTVLLKGDWTNNSTDGTYLVFTGDGSTVQMIGNAQSIAGTASTNFYNLTLAGTAASTKTLNVNTNVGGISTLTGVLSVGSDKLDLNSKTLTVTNPATTAITYGTGYIISETPVAVNPSKIQWNMGAINGAHVYPFGVLGTQIPFTFNKTAGTANITVSTRATGSDNTPWAGVSSVAAVANMTDWPAAAGLDGSIAAVIDRWWDITASAAATADLTFTYRGSENTTTFLPGGTFAAQHWNGTEWDPPVGSGPGVVVGVASVTANAQSTFSPWVLSSLTGPLPIELLSFTGVNQGQTNLLQWTTATETNNDYFTLERSLDASTYEMVGIIDGAGNSTTVKDYSKVDEHPYPITYYRLKQTDFNGHFTYSNVVTLRLKDNNAFGFNIYPNPNDGSNVNAVINAQKGQEVLVVVYDVLGQETYSKVFVASETGNNVYAIDMTEKLSHGIYYISATSDDRKYTKTLIVQ